MEEVDWQEYMTEKFPDNSEGRMDGIVMPNVFLEHEERQDDKHKPSIFDIEGALKILDDEENGVSDNEENHTIN